MANRVEQEELKSLFRETMAQQSRMLKVPTAMDGVRQGCIGQVIEAVESFLLSWEQQYPFTEIPCGLVRDAFSILLSAVGPGDALMRENILSWIVAVQSMEARQVLLDVLPSTMPLDNDGLEEATNQVLEALETILRKDWTAIMPILGCLSILPLDDKGKRQVLELALANLSVVSEPELPVLIRTLLRRIVTDEDAKLALTALRSEMFVWETSTTDEANDEGVLALVIHIVLSSFQDSVNGAFIKAAYLAIIQDVVKSLNDQMDESVGGTNANDSTKLVIIDVAALLLLREDLLLSEEAETAIDNLLRMNSYPFASVSSLLNFTFDRKRRKPSLLHDILGASLVSFCFFLLLFPVRVVIVSDFSTVMSQTEDFVELLYDRLDIQKQRELVLGFVHLSDESSFSTPKNQKQIRGRLRGVTKGLQLQRRRVEGINTTISNVHAILQKLAKLDRATLSRFKEILMGRLTSTSTEAFAKSNQRSMQQLCTTLSRLVEPVHAEPGGGRGIDASEILIFLQKLLFASSQSFHSQVIQEIGADVGRTIRGISLATELVKSPCLSHGDKDCIEKWVLRILLPSTRRMVDPEIGWPGLCFFEALAEHRTGTLQNKSELFSNLKMILANTGLIQMLAHYQQRRKVNSGTVLGYSKIPPHFHVEADTKNQRKRREMVFCLSILMRHIDTTNPHRWDCAVRWVFDLVNKYLRIGREMSGQGSHGSAGNRRSKWMPHSWLQAAIELPILDVVPTNDAPRTKIEVTIDWIHSKLCSHELSFDDHLCDSIDADIGNLLVESKTSSQLQALCGALSRMSLAIILSLGVAAAVLANTFEHYKTEAATPVEAKESSRNIDVENQGLLRLLQYQLYKIYDLKEKSKIVQKLLIVCGASMRRCKSATKFVVKRGKRKMISRSDGDSNAVFLPGDDQKLNRNEDVNGTEIVTKVATDCASVAHQTCTIVTSVFASRDFIDPTILWECLTDKAYDTVMNRVLAYKDNDLKADDDEFGHMIWMRQCIIEHLCANEQAAATDSNAMSLVDQLTSPQMSRAVTYATSTDFAHCFRQGSSLLVIMPKLRKHMSDQEEDVSKIVTSYFRIVLRVLESTRTCQGSIEPKERSSRSIPLLNTKGATYHECLQICGTGSGASESRDERAVVVETPSAEIAAFQKILGYLRECEDADISFLLMEILCVFAQRRKRELLDLVVDASWRDIHTIYSKTGGHSAQISLAFVEVLRRFQQTSPQRNQTSERVLLATVVKAALNQTKEFTRNSLLRHALLRHWGLITLSIETSGLRYFIHISKLIAELRSYLNSINEVQGDDFVATLANAAKVPTTSNDAVVPSIPGLTGASFAIYYELMLYSVVAMFAICPPFIASSTEACKRASPYQHLQQLMQSFSQLVGLLRENMRLFPRRLFLVFLSCCKHLMKLIVRQVRCCVDWRNSRPLLSFKEKAAGVDDLGSIHYLQDLLETCAANVPISILTFCKFISLQATGKRSFESEDSSTSEPEDGASWAFQLYGKKVKVLASTAENVLFFLRDTAASHNLALSHQLAMKKTILLSQDGNDGELDQSDVGFHQLGGLNSRSKKRLRRLTGSREHGSRKKGGSEWDEVSSDESSLWSADGKSIKGSSTSFGVAGDWGDDSDSEVSTASLNLEAMDHV